MGGNVTATLTAGIVSGDEATPGGTFSFNPTIEIAYSGAFDASLRVGDMNDKGASEYWYSDRSGMSVDVENQDNATDARALLQFGNFGVAVGCQLANTNSCGGVNVGAGATLGSIELGIGYDDGSNGQTAVTAVSADATFGSINVGVSYANSAAENSIGVAADTTFGAVKVGAYYASNSASNDAFGVSADYSAGALSIGAYYDSLGTATYGVDFGYAVNDQLTASAGVKAGGTTVFYAGIEYAVNSNISATVSYATADAISGPEFKDGITALITASF
jgi:hypothetical protein